MYQRLNWSYHMKEIMNKGNFHQSIAITFNKMKLEAIEQRALTTVLDVSKLAKRTEVNLEVGVLPLELRLKRKCIIASENKF